MHAVPQQNGQRYLSTAKTSLRSVMQINGMEHYKFILKACDDIVFVALC